MVVRWRAEKVEGIQGTSEISGSGTGWITWACSGRYVAGDMSPLRCPGVCVQEDDCQPAGNTEVQCGSELFRNMDLEAMDMWGKNEIQGDGGIRNNSKMGCRCLSIALCKASPAKGWHVEFRSGREMGGVSAQGRDGGEAVPPWIHQMQLLMLRTPKGAIISCFLAQEKSKYRIFTNLGKHSIQILSVVIPFAMWWEKSCFLRIHF